MTPRNQWYIHIINSSSFINNKKRDDPILSNNPKAAEDNIIDDQVNYANYESLFLLHEDFEEVEEKMCSRIRSYVYHMQKKISCLNIFNQLWIIHVELEERVVSLIYCLMIGTKQKSYIHTLEIIRKEFYNIVLEEQGTKPTSAGRPSKNLIGSIRIKSPKLVLLDFEAAQYIAFMKVFECATQEC
ncbi:hypothetical protein DSO57_1015682 [Entomophthora muscae]|uniref:Uncharacterized protein n=2 Tax=Entomophthora muscae TaxID=34485 RepID=A0ACC2UQX0_9FUNG|nr:hypothetical protein DSO57_1037456 [Entomophthora muscae]KAJ9089172.1 hypothetical protein DSO57_1015682 [Entomophthora muscae]